MEPNNISAIVKALRKENGLTQEDLALKSGVGLRFVRELEQGKPTVRMDKVNQVLNLFNKEVGVCDKARHDVDTTFITEEQKEQFKRMIVRKLDSWL